jgi:aminopeptidase YwaD
LLFNINAKPLFTQPLSTDANADAHVIAVRPTANDSSPIIIFSAHFDSVGAGPGATDDASGTALVLELAHIFRARYPGYELRFVAFIAEEQGLLGSQFYAARLSSDERKRIVAVINLDSAAVGHHLLVVGDQRLAGIALAEGKRLGLPIEDYTVYNGVVGSDHLPFMRTDVPAITLGRWLDHYYHQPGDIPARVSPAALVLMGGLTIAITDKLTAK